ncbi:MAG: chemotaxis protein CheW [Lachnospirales bacterium]
MSDFDRGSMLEMFIYEMNQLVENLEQTILGSEGGFDEDAINEIFRIMHTIKGSSAMMLYDDISSTAHAVEDMFFYLRENDLDTEYSSEIADVVFEAMDFIKLELEKLENGETLVARGNEILHKEVEELLAKIKGENSPTAEVTSNINAIKTNCNSETNSFFKEKSDDDRYKIKFTFVPESEMKNIRAFTIYSNFESKYTIKDSSPKDLFAEESEGIIEKNGYKVEFIADDNICGIVDECFKASNVSKVDISASIKGTYELSSLNKFSLSVELVDDVIKDYQVFLNFILSIQHDLCYMDIINLDIRDLTNKLNLNVFTTSEANVVSDFLNDISEVKSFVISDYKDPNITTDIMEDKKIEPIAKTEEVKDSVGNTAEDTIEDVAIKENTKVKQEPKKNIGQQVISVNVGKLDQLLNLVGELVTTEAMVTQNPELEDLELENFYKDARQLHKIINDVQDIVMSMRMVPLSTVFLKMHRIVRDMSKKLGKSVKLDIIGEETEVDKNIIEHIQDPLMHIIRNAIDHGIEDDVETRIQNGKNEVGTVTLEAKNSGGDVLIYVRDDGAGINTEKVLSKAKKVNLIDASMEREYTEKEIQQFIFRAGFSTNEEVTNYSGRGVGMDVVLNNIQIIGGSVEVDSERGKGSSFVLKIPLTLAIIDGMLITIGDAKYMIPIVSIRQSFKATSDLIHVDPNGNEMIKVRGEMYNLVRLSNFFDIPSNSTCIEDGIVLLVEDGNQSLCLFADELIGEYPVVVKSMPRYIKSIRAISGCTLLGNGDISLIIDIAGFFSK